MLQKLSQFSSGRGFKIRSQLIKCLQIGRLALAAVHGGIDAVHTGHGKDLLNQLGNGIHSGFPAQYGKCFEKRC